MYNGTTMGGALTYKLANKIYHMLICYSMFPQDYRAHETSRKHIPVINSLSSVRINNGLIPSRTKIHHYKIRPGKNNAVFSIYTI